MFALTDRARAPKASARLSCQAIPRTYHRQTPEQNGHPRLTHRRSNHERLPRTQRKHAGREGKGFPSHVPLDGGRIVLPPRPSYRPGCIRRVSSLLQRRVQFGKPISSFQQFSDVSQHGHRRGSSQILTYYQHGATTRARTTAKKQPWPTVASECAAKHTNRAIQIHAASATLKPQSRAALPRRQDYRDLRRHQRSHENGYLRQRAALAIIKGIRQKHQATKRGREAESPPFP